MMKLVYRSRVAIIELGKTLPFIICAIVAMSYFENITSLYTCDFIEFSNGCYLNKPVSWAIGEYFELDVPTWAVLAVLSVAIRACIYNKLAVLYLAGQLYEKAYFQTHELANYESYYIISVANIVICLFLVVKGIKQTFK